MLFSLTLLSLLLVTGTAWSDQVSLHPPATAVELRTYGFGLIAFDGSFTRFRGWMRYDPSNAGAAEVMLEIDAASLVMSHETILERIIGPEMMDVARFPDLVFHGACQGKAILGDLTMHGETHPVSLDYVRSAGAIIATGQLRRADWGITASPLIGGSTIRIRVMLPDPFGAQNT